MSAYAFPPKYESDFYKFLQGENPPAIMPVITSDGFHDMKEVNQFRDALAKMHKHVKFVLFGVNGDVDPSGENAMDGLKQPLLKLLRKEPASRILIPNLPMLAFSVAKRDLMSRNHNYYISFPKEINRELGEDKVAAVLEHSKSKWLMDSEMLQLNNLGSFLANHPIKKSVGLRLGNSALDKVRFETDYVDGYDAWDGVIVWDEGKDDDGWRDTAEKPDPSISKKPRSPQPVLSH